MGGNQWQAEGGRTQERAIPPAKDVLDRHLTSQILANKGNSIPILQWTVERMANVQDGIIHQDFDVLTKIAALIVPERLMKLWKSPAKAS